MNWAMYLGHHHSFRREQGEQQITVNYYRTMIDYINRFVFGSGVHFAAPFYTEAIVPNRLQRAWEVDNDKPSVLMDIAQQGSVSGDCFVKVAYEEPFTDPVGRVHPGRVRILPLNASFCYPEFHPHDKERLIRFKLKYRFWGTALDGTRQVFTYVEIITDDIIEEYLNDELIDSRPNPLGVIPIAFTPNIAVSGSPWGLSDGQEIVSLNRTYNEISTDVADIISYHAAPVTVITGAKANNLIKGANKVWGGLPKDSKVQNLEGGYQGLQGAIQFLELIKRSMHEIMGIPETALGQVQPISNTSGVALSILFQPLMNRRAQKIVQYGRLFEKINELIMLHFVVKEPESLAYNPDTDGPIKEGQAEVLDPQDPLTYQSTAKFMPPLPLDKLVLLNEIQMKTTMGLESKAGALRAMGEEFPEEKLAEIRQEMMEDARAEGALQLLRVSIMKQITDMTGMLPSPDGMSATPMDPMMMGDGSVLGDGVNGAVTGDLDPSQQQMAAMEMMTESGIREGLVTQAFGTKLAQRRNAADSERSS